MYQSTMEALTKLYSKLSPGGFVIIDDAGTVQTALRAVIDFRKQWRIDSPLVPVSNTLSWRKE
jgi:hypothetical protein